MEARWKAGFFVLADYQFIDRDGPAILIPLSNHYLIKSMSPNTLKKQIDAIHKATALATISRESAILFLTKSGILKNLPKAKRVTFISRLR